MLSLKCKLLISLPELQNVAAFPFSYISLMLSTLTQVSELPSVPTHLPETSSSVLSPQWNCPLKVRFVANCSVGTVLSSCFVLPHFQFSIYLEQLQNSQSAAPGSPEAGILWQDLSSACPQCAHSTSNKVTAQQCRSAEFLPFFPFVSSITIPEFLQPLSQICYSFNLFLESRVLATPLYKCLLWSTPQVLTRCENKVRSSCLVTRPCRWSPEEQKLLLQKILKR